MRKIRLSIHEFRRRLLEGPVELDKLRVFSEDRKEFASRYIGCQYSDVQGALQGCRGCTAAASRMYLPGLGAGSTRRGAVLIGRNPTCVEGRVGYPFPKGSYRAMLLSGLLQKIGLRREDVYIMYSMRCNTPRDVKPRQHDIDKCGCWTLVELRLLEQPRLILLLGSDAVRSVIGYGIGDNGLQDCLGRCYTYRLRQGDLRNESTGDIIRLVPTIHPVNFGLVSREESINANHNEDSIVRVEHVNHIKSIIEHQYHHFNDDTSCGTNTSCISTGTCTTNDNYKYTSTTCCTCDTCYTNDDLYNSNKDCLNTGIVSGLSIEQESLDSKLLGYNHSVKLSNCLVRKTPVTNKRKVKVNK